MSLSINDSEAQIDSKLSLVYDLLVPITKTRILATYGNEISLIDEDGMIIVTYDLIYIPTYIGDINMIGEGVTKYVEGYLIVVKGSCVGLIDYDGNIVIEVAQRGIEFKSQNDVEILSY